MKKSEDKKIKVKAAHKIKTNGFWKKFAKKHWFAPDLPNGEPIFQPAVFAKWCAIFVGLPIVGFTLALMLMATSEKGGSSKTTRKVEALKLDVSNSQIIDFRTRSTPGEYSAYAKRAPGTLVRVKLLNFVEGSGGAPVHAQILDSSLGKNLLGGTLLGSAASDSNLGKVTITFNFARDPAKLNVAIPIRARALSKDGTLGIIGRKKEGMLARSALGGASTLGEEGLGATDSFDIRHIFMKALATGFLTEAGKDVGVEQNRASLLTLNSNTEFFAELIDYFPGSSQ